MKEHKSGIGPGLLVISTLLFMCAPALAQHTDNLGGNWNDPAGGKITNVIVARYARRRSEKRPAVRHANSGSTINDGSVRFRSTGTQLKTREIANVISPGDAQVFTLLTTILQAFDKKAQEVGRPNDLALALSFFFATNASVYHDAGEPADPPVLELRDTIAATLVETNALNGVTDRKKQEMYEALVIYTGLALATYQEGKGGNPESLKIARQLAGQNLQAVIGISPDKISFNDQGLSIESEPGAAVALTTQSSPEPTNPEGAPAETVNAGKLVIDFEGNEVRANQMYGGKRIRVNGTVNSIDILTDGKMTLTFHSPAMGYAHTRCYFNRSQSSRLAQLSGGQEAIVEGTVRGFSVNPARGYVELENCIVP
jgi:tRNA_anti-like